MKILQLTNYPTHKPTHGGMIRAAQIARALRGAGHSVRSVAVHLESDGLELIEGNIRIAARGPCFDGLPPFLWDYSSGVAVATNPELFERLEAAVGSEAYDVILVEQPWLMAAAERLAGSKSSLVYSSHNIEWRLKRSSLLRPDPVTSQALATIERLEADAVARSTLVFACTDTDAAELQALGARGGGEPSKVVVCGNGVEPFSCDSASVRHWREFFLKVIGSPYAVYVSSAHPPNAKGFWDMMAPGLTFLRPDEEIVIVGSVCSILPHVDGADEYKGANLSRLHFVGVRETSEMQAMVRAAHVCILPISLGEGSNLKTAEALESGCRIVGTTKAFRGFADAMELPHVRIADSPREFRRALRAQLNAPRNLAGTPLPIRQRYHWSTQLKPLVHAFESLSRRAATSMLLDESHTATRHLATPTNAESAAMLTFRAS